MTALPAEVQQALEDAFEAYGDCTSDTHCSVKERRQAQERFDNANTALVEALLKWNAVSESKLDSIRADTIQECWDSINKYIVRGPLQGNGCDDTAQRNGMILATNVLHALLHPEAPKP